MKEEKDIFFERVIGFDVLRAIMLFCLFIFHSGVSFMDTTVDPEIWIYKDSSTHIFLDGLLGFVHTFRHPTFFLISGFVTEMMYRKYSRKVVILKRFQRLFLPFLIVAVFIGPLVYALLARVYGWTDIFTADVMFPATENFQHSFNTSYVWFLYYLVLYNVFHFIYHQFKPKLPQKIIKDSRLNFSIQLLLLIVASCVALLLWEQNSFFGLYSFFPHIGSLGGYALFYIFGIVLYRRLGNISHLKNMAFLFTTVGFVSLTLYFLLGLELIKNGESSFVYDWKLMLCSNFAAVFLSLGSIGLAIKYYTKQNRMIAFVSKSSYFLYLIHFPFVLLFLDIVIEYNWNAMAKFTFVLTLTTLTAFILNFVWIKAWKGEPPI